MVNDGFVEMLSPSMRCLNHIATPHQCDQKKVFGGSIMINLFTTDSAYCGLAGTVAQGNPMAKCAFFLSSPPIVARSSAAVECGY